ncbi:uncharacterized protein LOC134268607 [Saccostrea cucullata]|uniref:uncharacterized protein LOC134268607 n=1 Tax=Saccostrea cuccullata TaxID=36930 RepID=UPI002ED0EC20
MTWKPPKRFAKCMLSHYRVIIYENETEVIKTETTALKYSYFGFKSTSQYQIGVTPAFLCEGNGSITVYGKAWEENVSGIPNISNSYLEASENEKITVACPFLSRSNYHISKVIQWEHRLGINKIQIRKFTSREINLFYLSYMDMGEYYCTVNYKSCGSISGTVVSERSIVFVAVKGPPIIASLSEKERISRKLSLNVISLPSPDSNVSITNSKGTELSTSSARIRPGLVNYTAYGINVQIKGYKMDIVIEHAEIEWFGEIIVIVSNKLGSGKYRLMVKKSHESFFDESEVLPLGTVSGLIIVSVAIILICFIKKRTEHSFCLSKEKQQHIPIQLADQLYSRHRSLNQNIVQLGDSHGAHQRGSNL